MQTISFIFGHTRHFRPLCFTVTFHWWGRGSQCELNIRVYLKFGAASELRVRFHPCFLLTFPRRFLFCNSITKTCLFKYIENFTFKNWKFSDKKILCFSYFCSKYRLWYSLERPWWSGSNEYPQSMFLSRNKKNNVYPVNPVLLYKSGVWGGQYYIGMFS